MMKGTGWKGKGRGRRKMKETYHQSPLVLGLAPLETHNHVLVDQVLQEGPRVDGDETHCRCRRLVICLVRSGWRVRLRRGKAKVSRLAGSGRVWSGPV
jgi:hypothetical protein